MIAANLKSILSNMENIYILSLSEKNAVCKVGVFFGGGWRGQGGISPMQQIQPATTRKFAFIAVKAMEGINNMKYEERNGEKSTIQTPFYYKPHIILDTVANTLRIFWSRNMWHETKIPVNDEFLHIPG